MNIEDRIGQREFGILAHTRLPILTGKMVDAVVFGTEADNPDVIVLINKKPDVESDQALVRLHSACITSEDLGSTKCDCASQLNLAISMISESDWGILVYLLKHEGRGIGLVNKIKAYALQNEGMDTVDANVALGFGIDDRDFSPAVEALKILGVKRVELLSNNPEKEKALDSSDIQVVQRISMDVPINESNRQYLFIKKQHFGHQLFRDPTTEFLSQATSIDVFEFEISRCEHGASALAMQIGMADSGSETNPEINRENVIAQVASAIRRCDCVGDSPISRVEDDRFILFLPNKEIGAAHQAAKELQKAIARIILPGQAEGSGSSLRMNFGIAHGPAGESAAAVVVDAISALDLSLNGGDPIMIYNESRACSA